MRSGGGGVFARPRWVPGARRGCPWCSGAPSCLLSLRRSAGRGGAGPWDAGPGWDAPGRADSARVAPLRPLRDGGRRLGAAYGRRRPGGEDGVAARVPLRPGASPGPPGSRARQGTAGETRLNPRVRGAGRPRAAEVTRGFGAPRSPDVAAGEPHPQPLRVRACCAASLSCVDPRAGPQEEGLGGRSSRSHMGQRCTSGAVGCGSASL